eukprot:m.731574 g.731574  ORF g.731574 m.731574 type:complete len:101 (-) comp23060_c0_seq12:55-357(-)
MVPANTCFPNFFVVRALLPPTTQRTRSFSVPENCNCNPVTAHRVSQRNCQEPWQISAPRHAPPNTCSMSWSFMHLVASKVIALNVAKKYHAYFVHERDAL